MNAQFYVFRCVKCGEYPVPADYFDRFLTPQLRLEVLAKAEASGLVLSFHDCCPSCRPDGQSEASLIALWPKTLQPVGLWDRLTGFWIRYI
jgi:hypothetical protein